MISMLIRPASTWPSRSCTRKQVWRLTIDGQPLAPEWEPMRASQSHQARFQECQELCRPIEVTRIFPGGFWENQATTVFGVVDTGMAGPLRQPTAISVNRSHTGS